MKPTQEILSKGFFCLWLINSCISLCPFIEKQLFATMSDDETRQKFPIYYPIVHEIFVLISAFCGASFTQKEKRHRMGIPGKLAQRGSCFVHCCHRLAFKTQTLTTALARDFL